MVFACILCASPLPGAPPNDICALPCPPAAALPCLCNPPAVSCRCHVHCAVRRLLQTNRNHRGYV
jgi:hypothetical protein